jgi:flagellar M-ring protein FliF
MDAGFLTQLKAINNGLTLNQKLSIASLGVVVLSAVLMFAYIVQREPYQLLFSDLDASNASSVVDRLRTMNVPYRLADGGRSVQVPGDRVDRARIELAGQGLPTVGRMGFELFDQSSWGITDFAESVNYRRALEGELERTIISLTEIRQARVHLVMEKQSLFEEDSKPAKASVVVSVGGGALTRPRTTAIRNLVAFSVEGLFPQNVTVVDVNGNLLSEPLAEDESLTDAQLGFRRRYEKDLCDKVTALLEPILGHENIRVSASAQFDFSETTEKLERVLDPVVISQQISREAVNSPVREGIPFRANDPALPDAEAAVVGRDGRNFETETTNYQVSKSVRQTVLPSGGLLRQSVAVVVNDRAAQPEGEGGEDSGAGSRSPEEMERIRNLVGATIGLNAERGDTLIVENVSFSGRPDTLPSPLPSSFWEQNRNYLYPAARYLGILLLFGLFYLMIFRPVKKKVFAYVDVEHPQQRRLAAMNDPELLKQLEEALASGERALPGVGSGTVADKNAVMKKELLSLAKEDPQAVTHLIRSWLSEGV